MRLNPVIRWTILASLLGGAVHAQGEGPLAPATPPSSAAGVVEDVPKASGELKAPAFTAPVSKTPARPPQTKPPGTILPTAPAVATGEATPPSVPAGSEVTEVTAPPGSPANEPSVLPPTDVTSVSEPLDEAVEVPEEIPDNGPGSINHPLISGAVDDAPVQETQPVPALELGVVFGTVLLLAVGYFAYTARFTDSDDQSGNGPPEGS